VLNIGTQPMDFFMKSTTAAFPPKESYHLTAERTILYIFELFVRTTSDGFNDMSSMRPNLSDDNRTDSLSNTILNRIDGFMRIIYQHGANLLRDIPNHFSQELSVSALFMWELAAIDSSRRRKSS
jgi:hypothetical protein